MCMLHVLGICHVNSKNIYLKFSVSSNRSKNNEHFFLFLWSLKYTKVLIIIDPFYIGSVPKQSKNLLPAGDDKKKDKQFDLMIRKKNTQTMEGKKQ